MRIVRNKDAHGEEIRKAIEANHGYCCCSIEKSEDTKCMCKDFKEKLEDPNFYGECHCGLFRKEKT